MPKHDFLKTPLFTLLHENEIKMCKDLNVRNCVVNDLTVEELLLLCEIADATIYRTSSHTENLFNKLLNRFHEKI